MGSSSSSHVKNIQLQPKQASCENSSSEPAKLKRESSARHKSFRNSSKVSSSADPAEKSLQNKDATQESNSAEQDESNKTAEELEKQLIESESQRLDLEDRVQTLEERLVYYNNQNLQQEEKSCDETLHAKDQYIAKLEKEKADIEMESNKLKQRSRKRIKVLSSKLSEFKQEANFQMMELREEIARLKEDNLTLQESAGDRQAVNSLDNGDTDGIPGGGKMKLILELSAQVTEQNEKISKLEKKLKEKDHIVDELRVKLKNNMEYLKARDEVGSQRNGLNDKNNNSHHSSKNLYPNNQNYCRIYADSSKKYADSAVKRTESSRNDVTALFAVTEEDSDKDFDDSDKMEKLTSLLKGVKAKNDKTRLSTDSLDDKKNAKDDILATMEDENEARKFSGTSRDSGLGSAGKHRQVQNSHSLEYDQKEPSFSLESGLSDSDNDNISHSKIASAPPNLERNYPGQKLKKKSSLKRRASQKNEKHTDRPHIPKPSLAFVNNKLDSVITDDNIYKIPGSSGLSSVQVS